MSKSNQYESFLAKIIIKSYLGTHLIQKFHNCSAAATFTRILP